MENELMLEGFFLYFVAWNPNFVMKILQKLVHIIEFLDNKEGMANGKNE